MIVGTLLAIGFSAICLFSLGLADPKRMRTGGMTGRPASSRKRLGLTLAALLPGMMLAAAGKAAALLVWLGGCGVTGWLTALWLGMPPEKRRRLRAIVRSGERGGNQ